MKTKRTLVLKIFFIALGLLVLLILAGCPIDPPADEQPAAVEETPEEEETPTTIPPPENLLGTIALSNGKSAVMDLQFAGAAASSASVRSQATVGVTGKVRYEGVDYNVGGLYNDGSGALDIIAENPAGERFIFSGTYSPGAGFSGTVTLYAADRTTVIATGSVSAAAAADEDRGTVKIYTGTFGGDAWGTWNGTLTADRFYGTWAGQTPEGPASGTFSMNKSGNTLSNLSGAGGPTAGGGTLSGTSSSGWWKRDWTYGEYSGTSSGSWSGAEVDANYDPHIPGSGSDNFYLASLIMQAFLNGITLYRNALNDELIEIGDEYSNITLTVHDYDSDGKNEDVYTFGGAAPYSDTQTGIELSEQVLIEKQDENGDVWHLSIDSDVTDFGGSPPTDNGGLRIDFPDESSVELFVDVEIDEVNMTIGPNNFETAVWELDGVDILGYILPIFF